MGMGATVTAPEAAVPRIKSPARTTPRAQAWAKLMGQVGEEFPLECPNCGGDIRLIAFITEPWAIRKILTHLGEPLEPPPPIPKKKRPTCVSTPAAIFSPHPRSTRRSIAA